MSNERGLIAPFRLLRRSVIKGTIAEKIERACGGARVRIKLLYVKEVRGYLMRIEEAHKRAAKSKLTFP